jgi:hypothetical protein
VSRIAEPLKCRSANESIGHTFFFGLDCNAGFGLDGDADRVSLLNRGENGGTF